MHRHTRSTTILLALTLAASVPAQLSWTPTLTKITDTSATIPGLNFQPTDFGSPAVDGEHHCFLAFGAGSEQAVIGYLLGER